MHANATSTQYVPMKRSISRILEVLRHAYGAQQPPRDVAPIDELIATILSQNTSDTNTERAYASLRQHYPTWDAVLAASDHEIADAIRTGGLADRKAPRIRQVLEQVRNRTGGFDLTFLRDMPLDEAKHWLQSLPGVGPKTAACVLLFSLHLPAMPVDTHVHRVALRLGWIAPGTTADRAHELLERQIDPERIIDAHLLLIQHGRITCHARRPACVRCVIAEWCPSAAEFLDPNQATR
jgi:endonuclease-3